MPSTLGRKLRKLREQQKLSLEQLAMLSGSSKSYLWNLENFESSNPSVEKIDKIATALKVTSEFLLNGSATTPDQGVIDEAFFRKYKSLPEADKKRLRQIVDVWTEEHTRQV
ncbi:predicted transcriptional regulator [Hahella chejuensis KCTC 2396]|uniref:Predicted transcriptional regulator n=1 Tax=Hahella chejuensis (strain KCTC 2396) TaxID=349521 RepID=Q2SAH3_HAHCH|nr:helix-turn-helix transcriptional regulator [Hahella chejuensis]ABC32351.1 predicted transcriptional regulator [Hahella chejuensis KCTC 2396]